VRKNILLVEEDADWREITKNVLIDWLPEVQVFSTGGGNMAKEILAKNLDIKLIITNNQLSAGNCVELLEHCRTENIGIPIIVFYNTSANISDLTKLGSFGSINFVSKPKFPALKKAVQKNFCNT